MEVFYPVDLLKLEAWELEYLEDWMLSTVGIREQVSIGIIDTPIL